jgi:hypothetical protein
MTKSTVVRGDSLFTGLNSFEPGQEHALHTHDGQDKLYLSGASGGDGGFGAATQTISHL